MALTQTYNLVYQKLLLTTSRMMKVSQPDEFTNYERTERGRATQGRTHTGTVACHKERVRMRGESRLSSRTVRKRVRQTRRRGRQKEKSKRRDGGAGEKRSARRAAASALVLLR